VLSRTLALVPRLPQTTYEHCAGCSGALPPPSPPAEKATTCQYKARQASTGDGTGNFSELTADFATLEWHVVNVCVSEPSLKIRDEVRHADAGEIRRQIECLIKGSAGISEG